MRVYKNPFHKLPNPSLHNASPFRVKGQYKGPPFPYLETIFHVHLYLHQFPKGVFFSQHEAKTLGLCALLHDVGKKKINEDILNASRKLTNAEFVEIKSHTTMGFNILRECKFNEKEISICAMEHHEKIDGSGYPNKKSEISRMAQIVGLIDSFETLSSDERIYRKKMKPFDVLNQVIKKDVNNGKIDAEIFSQFVKSLSAVKQI